MAAQFRFVMRSGPTAGKTYPLEGAEISIGRDSACKIAINDAEVSRKHARLVWKENGYVLEDLGSTNGTFINGQRISAPYALKAGELVTFGENIVLMYEAAFDADATVLSSAKVAKATAPVPKPAPAPIPVPVPVYSGQIPAEPVEAQEPAKKKINIWLIIAIAVLLVICACVAFFVLIDQLNLWCSWLPFLVPLLGGACP
jgi:hypothetical protein